MCIENETQLKGLLRIMDWGQLSGPNILKYIKLLPNLSKNLHFKMLEQVPDLVGNIGKTMDLVKKSIDESKQLSSETKETYDGIVKTLEEMLHRGDLSREDHEKIFGELVKIASFVNTAGQREEEFLEKVVGDIFKTAAGVLLLTGLFLGGKSLLASLL